MSDPFRDAAARKRSEKKEKVRDEYTPLVLWVKVPEGRKPKRILSWVQGRVGKLPYVAVATSHAPYPYATDGAIREENADGNTDTE